MSGMHVGCRVGSDRHVCRTQGGSVRHVCRMQGGV